MKFLQKIGAIIFLLMLQFTSFGQCAMCKATAESNPNVGGGLNAGIEYILVIPYLLLGTFVLLVLKGKLKPFLKDLIGKDKGAQKNFTAKDWY